MNRLYALRRATQFANKGELYSLSDDSVIDHTLFVKVDDTDKKCLMRADFEGLRGGYSYAIQRCLNDSVVIADGDNEIEVPIHFVSLVSPRELVRHMYVVIKYRHEVTTVRGLFEEREEAQQLADQEGNATVYEMTVNGTSNLSFY